MHLYYSAICTPILVLLLRYLAYRGDCAVLVCTLSTVRSTDRRSDRSQSHSFCDRSRPNKVAGQGYATLYSTVRSTVLRRGNPVTILSILPWFDSRPKGSS
ncbi:hypothetical protein BJ875DRAFT_454216 [Amylocarpus encephaloides]|uniref:Secreted protein n=1 Tax=Amylocarpus encephaloides TaxID=45428 RepID=A0A9P8C8D9_9HELO|nr:hypothetical protein BJ875DRAFT_454216 [Amylocarpus encephaloides]